MGRGWKRIAPDDDTAPVPYPTVALQTAEIPASFGYASFPAGSYRQVMDAGPVPGCGHGSAIGATGGTAFPLGIQIATVAATRIVPGRGFA